MENASERIAKCRRAGWSAKLTPAHCREISADEAQYAALGLGPKTLRRIRNASAKGRGARLSIDEVHATTADPAPSARRAHKAR